MPQVAYSHKDPSPTEGMSSTERTLVLAVLTGLAAVAAVLVLSIRHLDAESSVRQFFIGLSEPTALLQLDTPDGLSFGPMEMGMAAGELRKNRIDARFYRANGGNLIAHIEGRKAAYTAWFSSGETSGVITRIRYDQTFTNHSVNAILDNVGQRFGKPISSWCDGGAVNGAQECTFRWVPKQATVVDARYRLDSNSEAQQVVVFSIIASDSRALVQRKAPHTSRVNTNAPAIEKLPF